MHKLISHSFSHIRVQHYNKCSKISNTGYLLKRHRQTVQTQIRLLLKKQSDQGLLCLLFWQEFCEFQPWSLTFYWDQKEKSDQKFITFTIHWPVSHSCSHIKAQHYLDQSSLHVSSLSSFDCCIYQPLSTSHSMEEEFCRSEARIETVLYKPSSCWIFGWNTS